MKKQIIIALFLVALIFSCNAFAAVEIERVVVNGVCRAWKYYDSAGTLRQMDIFYDSNVTDYGAAATAGTIGYALANCTNVRLASPGVAYPITTTLLARSETTLDLNGATIKLTTAANVNLLRNSNWGSAEKAVASITSADGITATVTTTPDHGYATGSYVFIYGAVPDAYNGVWKITSTGAKTFTYVLAPKAPSETLTTPATGTIVAREGNANISIINGTVDYDYLNQTTADTYDRHGIYLRRVSNVRLQNLNSVNTYKYAINLANAFDSSVSDIFFDTESDGLHISGSARNISARNLRGKAGDDLFAVTQGDYTQYVDAGYITGDITQILVDGIQCVGAFSAVKIVPVAGHTFTDIFIKNVHGRFSGGSGYINIVTDTDVGAAGTIGSITIDGVKNFQSSSKPIVQYSSTISSLQLLNVDVILGTTAGTSALVLGGDGGVITRLMGNNWRIAGGSGNAVGVKLVSGATLSNVSLANFDTFTLGALFAFNAGSTAPTTLNAINGTLTTCGSFIATSARAAGNTPIQLNGSNITYNDGQTSFLYSEASPGQISAKLTNCSVPAGLAVSGTWLNIIADWLPSQRDVPAWSASVTPDHSKGQLKQCIISADATINAPSNVFASNGQHGTELIFLLIEDETGNHTLTWNTIYKFEGAFTQSGVGSASKTSVVRFIYDNNAWRQIGSTNTWN